MTPIRCVECGQPVPAQPMACPTCGSFLRAGEGEVSVEGRGHPRAARAVRVVTVWLTLVLAGGALLLAVSCADYGGTCGPRDLGTGILLFVPAVVCLVGGLWLARWVGTGYWGRRPRLPSPWVGEPPPRPLASDDPYEPRR
jgi:hypothetical protein